MEAMIEQKKEEICIFFISLTFSATNLRNYLNSRKCFYLIQGYPSSKLVENQYPMYLCALMYFYYQIRWLKTKKSEINCRSFLRIAGVFLMCLGINRVSLLAQADSVYNLPEQVILDSVFGGYNPESHHTLFLKDSTGTFGVTGVSADAVLRQASGVYIRNYGGHGGIKTVSFRGFAANQTTVSINDIPYQMPQSSVIDLNGFYLEGLSGIEVQQSGAGQMQNPGGGNINFLTERVDTRRYFFVGTGSFGEITGGVQHGFKYKKHQIEVAYQGLSAKDNYPFQINGERGIRKNAGFFTQRFQVHYHYNPNAAWTLSWFMTGFNTHQGVPGPVLTGQPQQLGDSLFQKDIFYYLKIEHAPRKFRSLWLPFRYNFSISHHRNDMDAKVSGLAARYRNDDVMIQGDFRYIFLRQTLQTVFQVNPSFLTGDNLAIKFQPVRNVQRTLWNVGIHHNLYWGEPAQKGYLFQTQTTFRLNYNRTYGLLPNGAVTANYYPFKGATNRLIFGSIHYGNRVPSFNELYYFGYGNSELNPEKTISGEFGVYIKEGKALPFVFRWNLFMNYTQDKIIAVPLNPVQWSTQSIGLTRTVGMEYSLEFRLLPYHYLYLNYTLQRATDETRDTKPLLPYTPREILNYGYRFSYKEYYFFLNGNYSGWRFSLIQNDARSFMPAWHLIDAGLGYKFSFKKWESRFSVEVQNILNTQYSVIRSYPMPAASAGFKVEIRR